MLPSPALHTLDTWETGPAAYLTGAVHEEEGEQLMHGLICSGPRPVGSLPTGEPGIPGNRADTRHVLTWPSLLYMSKIVVTRNTRSPFPGLKGVLILVPPKAEHKTWFKVSQEVLESLERSQETNSTVKDRSRS